MSAPDVVSAEDLGPALLRCQPLVYQRLLNRARWLSARYFGGAVYLVGSAVTSEDPRDLDVVIVIPVDLFLASYGEEGDTLETFRYGGDRPTPPKLWQRWARDCAKQGAAMTLELGRAVDFKVQHDRDLRTVEDRPRVLLCHVAGGRW